MGEIPKIILYSLSSGATVFFGGLLAKYFERYFRDGQVKAEIVHTSIAFGGGILVAAVSMVLVPKGMSVLPLVPIAIIFLSGVITFYFIDKYIARKGGMLSQLLAMLLDFVPESIALGAVFATDSNLGLLLAIFIGLQNFPESFNSYLDLKESGYTSKKCLVILFLLSFPGVIAAISGYYLLSNMPMTTAGLMLFSSGGIIYLVFQDIVPMSKLKKNWLPGIGASLGFLIGMIGQKMLG